MKSSALTKDLFNIRSLLLIAVVLGLCVCEGVGLQLLPFPDRENACSLLKKPAHAESAEDYTRASSKSGSLCSRVEIVAPKLKRPSFEQPLHIGSAALIATNPPEGDSLRSLYTEETASAYSFIFASQSAGRSPPPTA
jgi:hypothetical protein